MSTLIELSFVADSVEINPPDKNAIRPKLNYRVGTVPTDMKLEFSIVEAGVNLEVSPTETTQELTATQGDFRKQVTFNRIATGTKKNFTLRVKGTVGSTSLTDTLAIIYN